MEITAKEKKIRRAIRAKRARKRLGAFSRLPRLSVFRSGKHIYAQVIDDGEGKTIAAASDREVAGGKKGAKAGPEEVGKLIAGKALEKGIKSVAFDRGGYRYHGAVKALAEGARKGGLLF